MDGSFEALCTDAVQTLFSLLQLSQLDCCYNCLSSTAATTVSARLLLQLSQLDCCYNCLSSTAPDYVNECLKISHLPANYAHLLIFSILCLSSVRTTRKSFFLRCTVCLEHSPLRSQVSALRRLHINIHVTVPHQHTRNSSTPIRYSSTPIQCYSSTPIHM